MKERVSITESPRDAMQGWTTYIPAHLKADYINLLLKVGFDVIDFGSFVSPRVIPQMRDTATVLNMLDVSGSTTKLLAIVGNMRGAKEAANFDKITYLGYPHSVSPTFLQMNTHTTQQASRKLIEQLQELALRKGKKVVVYLSMAFGNPYKDSWSVDLLLNQVAALQAVGVERIALSDTIGIASPAQIETVFSTLQGEMYQSELGLHLHTRVDQWRDKVDAAYRYGCRNFDSVISGYGGCPLSGYPMVGNLPTENLLEYFDSRQAVTQLNRDLFEKAFYKAFQLFHFFPVNHPNQNDAYE